MKQVSQDNLVVHLPSIKEIQENLEQSHQGLERIQKSLNDYLETKRQYFPRFYFLSNEDLLEILGESKKPAKVNMHLKKCFEGINEVLFASSPDPSKPVEEGSEEILSIVSREHERVNLAKSIFPGDFKGNVEQWLLELETQMKLSMREVMTKSVADHEKHKKSRTKWLQNWQSQIVLAVSQIYWTRNIES
jgi:dynein heavy chain